MARKTAKSAHHRSKSQQKGSKAKSGEGIKAAVTNGATNKPRESRMASLRPPTEKLSRPKVLSRRLKPQAIVSTSLYARWYAVFAVAVLGLSALFWSFLGAHLQLSNADQLADPDLFSSGSTFREAQFPGAHSFLIKWPLFWLVKLFGITSNTLVTFTVLATVVTVAVLAFVLYRIERRPAVFGTLCLALASCLLLVPPVPTAGTLLPVNMAMLATRNLEYVWYLLSLVVLVKSWRLRQWRFWLAAVLLGLLVASDKLFLAISLGAASMALLVYALRRNARLAEQAARWLFAGIMAVALAYALLIGLQAAGITHITHQTEASPYQTTSGIKNIATGVLYDMMGLLTNFGANPAASATVVSKIPSTLVHNLASFAGPAYFINFVLFLGGLYAAWRLVKPGLFGKTRLATEAPDRPTVLGLLMVWSGLAALGFFVVTGHYYAVDARYVTICLFSLFVAAAAYARQISVWRSGYLIIAGKIILLGMLLALPVVWHDYVQDKAALADMNQRDKLVAQAVTQHKVTVLVGDYWRVMPIRLATHNNQQVMPLANCTQPRDVLTSKAWEPNLQHQSFAYLLSYDRSLTDFPNCNLHQIVTAYGSPNASILIAGNFAHPKEVLLFYDHGAHQQVAAPGRVSPQPLASVAPITVDELPNVGCTGPTIMNVIAHQDDDLLFMNPDLLHDIHAGHCVRTVYITAGDAGSSQFYWLSRQQGSEDAYASMLGMPDVWLQRTVKLSNNSYVSVVSPRSDPKISLIFMNLPDGGLNGQGFRSSRDESLSKLESGAINQIATIDHQSTYSSAQLVTSLALLMQTYLPTEIRTQATTNMSQTYPDHSDHIATGQFTEKAYAQFEQAQYENKVIIPISYYIGYPIRDHDQNVSGTDLAQKEAAFFAYAKHDGGVCASAAACANVPTYGSYLQREYQQDVY